jgi:restriction endonuclease S subunit
MYKKTILIILFFWFGISILRTISNFSKLYTEELKWLGKNPVQKNKELFGNDYFLFDYVKSRAVGNSDIVIFSKDAKPYLYGRYILYPRRIILVRNVEELENSLKNEKNSLFILYKLNAREQEESKSMLRIVEIMDGPISIGVKKQ